MPQDTPTMLPIKKIQEETDCIRTYTFEYKLNSRPGQFVMLWVPGVDMKPFSIGKDAGEEFELTICRVGKATEALFELKQGDSIGITGPYGSCYRHKKESHVITVAGGYGAAPLGYLADNALADNCTVDFLVGARNADLLLFEERMTQAGANVQVATDDGSKGHKGYVTEILVELLEKNKKEGTLEKVKVFTCGPELMQKKVAEIAQEYGVQSEVSVERYMKCGFGICGNCCIDDEGITLCQHGPVILGDRALKMPEFGAYHRDKSGLKHEF